MIDIEHAKRALNYQSKALREIEENKLLLEMAERLIAMENRLARNETRTKELLDDFLRGAKNLSVRFDRLEAKLDSNSKQGT